MYKEKVKVNYNLYFNLSNEIVVYIFFLLFLSLKKNTEAAAHRCSVGVLKNQKQTLADMFFEIGVLKNFAIFKGKHLCWSLFLINIVNIAKYLIKNSFFHKTPPVAASEKFINFPGKHQWQRRNRFIFLINTTE